VLNDRHITALLGAAETLVKAKDEWSGTLILCFQPAEEKGGGAEAMVKDGLYDKVPKPDVVVGAHVVPERAGVIGTKHGLIASSADSFKSVNLSQTRSLNLRRQDSTSKVARPMHQLRTEVSVTSSPFPRTPNNLQGIDPIVQAASTIMRLQTIPSREVDPLDMAVVTVSAIHAGDAENIIPEEANLKLNIRAARPETREHVLKSLTTIINAEATASSNPKQPTLTATTRFPFLFNDSDVTGALEKTFAKHFEPGKFGYQNDIARLQGSEDFGILATSIGKPSCFFLYGGIDPEVYDRAEKEGRLKELPGNHSPFFAPVVQPTLSVGMDGYVVAALTFLGKGN
jgi:metal-dependent amidase/aminoacylase/carboxypeptidase family protein